MSENAQAIEAFILDDEIDPSLVVGGIGLLERWEREFLQFHLSPRKSRAADLADALRATDRPLMIAIGNWSVENLAFEAISEAAATCQADEALVLTAPDLPLAPMTFLGKDAARQAAGLLSPAPHNDMDSLVDELEKTGRVKIRRVAMAVSFWQPVSDAASAKRATWGLLKRLQYRPGGVVAKFINRPVSIRMTRHLVNTPLSANGATWIAFVIGAVGVGLVFLGGYWEVVLGGALLQFNSIFDGIDGELARLRVRTSSYGAYLDSVCDEILNAALFVAIGYNLYRHGGWLEAGWPLYPYLGLFTGGMAFIYSLVHWHCKWKHGLGFYWWFDAYKPRKQVQRSTSLFTYFKKLFWKESYLLIFFVLTIFQVYEVLLWASLPVALNTVVFFFIHIVIKRARW